jgi:hypothetical protein
MHMAAFLTGPSHSHHRKQNSKILHSLLLFHLSDKRCYFLLTYLRTMNLFIGVILLTATASSAYA